MTQEKSEREYMTHAAPLAMIAFAVPLFIWSGFNAGYFEGVGDNFIIPLAVFFGAPIAFATAMWAYYHKEPYLATAAGIFAAFWASYGMMRWMIQRDVITGDVSGDLMGFFFLPWAATFGLAWLGSLREHWTLALVSLGATVMFVVLSIGHYAGENDLVNIGGWVGFATSGLAWYAALAELLNIEFKREVLPTDAAWFDQFRPRTR
jgi:succinate-acetate transporter protein